MGNMGKTISGRKKESMKCASPCIQVCRATSSLAVYYTRLMSCFWLHVNWSLDYTLDNLITLCIKQISPALGNCMAVLLMVWLPVLVTHSIHAVHPRADELYKIVSNINSCLYSWGRWNFWYHVEVDSVPPCNIGLWRHRITFFFL